VKLIVSLALAIAWPEFTFGQTGSGAAIPPQPVSAQIIQLTVLVTVLSLAPALLVMVTSFTRFAVSLSFLRAALGIQGAPANITLVSLALMLTAYVMTPTFEKAWQEGIQPYLNQEISESRAVEATAAPFIDFMRLHTRPKDMALFEELAGGAAAPGASGLRVVVPAFMVSELRRGFEIGFLITLPFLVIDIVVAIVAMSVGMMMMPPAVISLPIKIIFFIVIDGWNLLAGSLVRSYG